MKQITIGGKLGRDAELKHVGGGSELCAFSVAVDHRVKTRGGWEKHTLWFDCALWGKRGEALAPHLMKGTSVTVTGDLGVNEFTRKNGEPGFSLTLKVDNLTLMGSKQDRQQAPPAAYPDTDHGATPSADYDNDDIPF